MKVQELAIIFVIIILPISIVISAYTQGQIKTINTQSVYDAKLTSATYDAIKAFQINTANDTGSDLANSKLNDIENSVKTFKSSIISSFGLNGYAEEEMDNYIPALVYTLYDGFYIYSPYENVNYQGKDGDGEKLYGLKPYISYSCRYKASTSKGEVDVVITYALDNYVSIQGTVDEKYINESGYLIDGIKIEKKYENDREGYKIWYNGIEIKEEELLEDLPMGSYPYVKINGIKYYKMGDNIVSFSNDGIKIQASKLGNSNLFDQYSALIEHNNMAREYYYEAFQFTETFKEYGLDELKFEDAYVEVIDGEGDVIPEKLWENDKREIFEFSGTANYKENIENQSSNFNEHRLAVIRNKIERNLAIAVANFNVYSGIGSTNEFQMPELKEDEWRYITHNISLISFLQGLNIGEKKYNGYTIVTNSESKEVVLEEHIYILGNKNCKNEYYRVGDKGFKDAKIEVLDQDSQYSKGEGISAGRLNLDFKRNKIVVDNASYYYYPLKDFDASYSSIVMRDEVYTYDDIYIYIVESNNDELKEAFYTALARERYGLYKTSIINIDEVTNNMAWIVTYNANGGDWEEPPRTLIKDVNNDITLNCPNIPKKDGYRFLGWNTDPRAEEADLKYNNGEIYKENATLELFAIWEPIMCKIEYTNSYEGVTNMPASQENIKYGTKNVKISEKIPQRFGYTFSGWEDSYGKEFKPRCSNR